MTARYVPRDRTDTSVDAFGYDAYERVENWLTAPSKVRRRSDPERYPDDGADFGAVMDARAERWEN